MTSQDLGRALKARQTVQDRVNVPTSKSIRQKCLECSSGSRREVQLCQVFDCPLWLCRFGKRPSTVLQRSPEWLDPVHVAMEAEKQCQRECGETEWANPLTGTSESLCSPTNPTLIASFADDVTSTASESCG